MGFDRLRREYGRRMAAGRAVSGGGPFVEPDDAVKLLEAIVEPGDRVALEGNNQKQAKFLAAALTRVDQSKVSNLHLVQSSIVLDEHLELVEKGIASRLDFSYSGPQSRKLYALVKEKKVRIGAIHTYLELYGRYFVDLAPKVALVVAESCDGRGNLYTGANTEDTPLICEATKVKSGLVVAEVTRKVETVPRVDVAADWVDFVVVTGQPLHVQPLFTRDPARITARQVLMAMMVLKAVYCEYGVKSLNHGIGFPTAAVELVLSTYGVELDMKGRLCTHWVLNPHPTIIPAIEEGMVESVHSFGSEPGMERYVEARSDVFAMGPDGSMRSNRAYAHAAGLYAVDCFTGATLQIDRFGNSSTAIEGMIAGFGGAPNLGSSPPGRRNVTDAMKKAGGWRNGVFRGRKLVVQVTPTRSEKRDIPVFVDELDAVGLAAEGLFDVPPVMITGDEVTHIVTELGVACLDRCEDTGTRRLAIEAVAGDTEVGRRAKKGATRRLRSAGIVRTPEDLGIDEARATREMLAARDIPGLVVASGGLYEPPESVLEGG